MLKFMVFAGGIYTNRSVGENIPLFKHFFNLIDDNSVLLGTTNMQNTYCKYGDYIIYKNGNCILLVFRNVLAFYSLDFFCFIATNNLVT